VLSAKPPITNPIENPKGCAKPKVENPIFRYRPGLKEAVRSATLVGMHIAIEMPWTARAPMSPYPSGDAPPAINERPRRSAPPMLITFGSVISAIAPAARRQDPLLRLSFGQRHL